MADALATLAALARRRLALSRDEFLRISPRELDLLFQQQAEIERERWMPAALICSVLANLHRDPEKRHEPYTIADFLPADASEVRRDDSEVLDKDMRDFIDALARGEEPGMNEQQLQAFKAGMHSREAEYATMGKVTRVGPGGKAERA